MNVDIDIIREKLKAGNNYIQDIRELLNNEFDVFVKDKNYIYSGERLFVILSTIVIDICTHIVSKSYHKIPSMYSECILHLSDDDLDILPEDLTRELVDVVRMRNKLAHQYEDIDPSTLFESLGKIINDFKQFQEHLEEKFEL